MPQPRVVPLRTPAGMLELAFALKRERPERTAAQVREIMLATAGEGEHVPGLRTLQTHLARQGLNVRADGRSSGKVYGRFEAGVRNELWTGDGLHGPKLDGGAARRAVLLAFINDHARLLVGWRWGTGEDVFRLEAALRAGLMSRGVPEAILVDRGSAFVSSQLLRACAVLGCEADSREPARGDHERQDRAVISDGPRSAPGRDRRRYRARRAEPLVLRVVGGRLSPAGAFRDRAGPAGPVRCRGRARAADPGVVARGVLVVDRADGDEDRDGVAARQPATRSTRRWWAGRSSWCSTRST